MGPLPFISGGDGGGLLVERLGTSSLVSVRWVNPGGNIQAIKKGDIASPSKW